MQQVDGFAYFGSASDLEHTAAARRVVLVAQCREGVLTADLALAEAELERARSDLASAHAEARLAR